MSQSNFLNNSSSSIIKPIIILSAIILVLWMMTLGQSDSQPIDTVTQVDQARLDSLRLLLGNSGITPTPEQDKSLIDRALPVFIILALLLAVLWWWNSKNKPKSNVLTNVVAEQEIGPGQFIKVISLGDDYLVLGVTPSNITLLKTISKTDWQPLIESNPLQTQSIFSQFMKRAEGNNEDKMA